MRAILQTGIFLPWIFLFSCNDPTQIAEGKMPVPVKDSIAPAHSSVVKMAGSTLGCFYVMNNKNAGSPGEIALNTWLQTFTDSIAKNGFSNATTLFSNGTGPIGSQWNPAADVVVTAYFSGDMDTASVKYSVNGYEMKKARSGIQKANDGYLCWFILDDRSMNVQRHLASAEEIRSICEMKNLDEKVWPKNAVTVVRISVSAIQYGKENQLQDYLLVSYGS